MGTYVSFLRGINMTGHNSVKMTDLSALFKKLGLDDPVTYIQSGNVIFNSEADMPLLNYSVRIEKAILDTFGYNVPVMIRTIGEMEKIITGNPFLIENHPDLSKLAVIFLDKKPLEEQIQKVINIDYPPDKFQIIGREIYIYCPNGFGKTRLYTNFFERKMDVTGTARNWKTITTILNIADKR